jgi:hypothetical protein
MKPTKQTVYLPVNGDYLTAVCHFEHTEWCHHETVQSKEGYFFTPEQLNQLLSDVIKNALNNASNNAKSYVNGFEQYQEGNHIWNKDICVVNKESITNTFDEIYQRLKV